MYISTYTFLPHKQLPFPLPLFHFTPKSIPTNTNNSKREGMTQMGLLRWPKTTASTGTAAATLATSTIESGSPFISFCCGCLTKLVKKLLRKQGRLLKRGSSTGSRQYDPLSYSLNFDTSGYESMMDDEDYYHFCAFSSRFVANPTRTNSIPPPLLATSH